MKIAAAVVCLAIAVALQVARDRGYPRTDVDTQKLLYIRSPEALQRVALGFDALAADVYWIRAIQHYGGDRLDPAKARRYELLYPLLDITTSLDPYFSIAYRFGAIFLSEPPPGGPGRPDQAIALLRKGLVAQPTRWEYFHDIAFVHYWALRDPIAAAHWFQRAAEQPGAPNWLAAVAAAMLTQGADRTSARFLWEQMLGSDQDWLRRRADHALKQLDALEQIHRLNAFIASLPKPEGQPYSWSWVTRTSGAGEVPRDPSGTPYEIDGDSGTITLSSSSPLFPLPKLVEPRR